MQIETVICLPDQLLVEPLFSDSRFIAGNQEYGITFRIKSKCYPPDSSMHSNRMEIDFRFTHYNMTHKSYDVKCI